MLTKEEMAAARKGTRFDGGPSWGETVQDGILK